MSLAFKQRAIGVVFLTASLALVACQSSNNGASAASGTAAATVSQPPSTADSPEASAAASPEASSEASTAAGVETSVFDIEAGDCFSASGDSVESVLVVPCEDAHIYEAYAVLEHPGGSDDPYPGEEEMVSSSDAACQEPFEGYVGRDYQSSEFYITTIYPSEETWAVDDREIICTLGTENDDEVTGSAEGSER